MPAEPAIKRTVAFLDGQNLFHAAKAAFGYSYPNFDPLALARAVAASKRWNLQSLRFYTGIPNIQDNATWHHFWTAKLLAMSRQGVHVFSRALRYRNQSFRLPSGQRHTVLVGQEKGIDVRLALDIVRMAWRGEYDVALVFSQDQDLSEVADEIRDIARIHQRWIKIACAFPSSPVSLNRRGINGTDWIAIDRATYDACLDPRNYRPNPPSP